MTRAILTRGAGIVATLLPSRYWNALERRVPVGSSAVLSGCVTSVAGALAGTLGFLNYAARQASALNDLTLQVAAQQIANPGNAPEVSSTSAMFGNVLAPLGFLFFTPLGWLTGYLTVTGALRAIAAYVDDPIGDPILTGVDAGVRVSATAFSRRQAARERLAREGAEIPDRLVSGKKAGLADADIVIVSSRRKEGWTRGLVVIMPEKWYRLGDPVERVVEGRLRTLYPLKEHTDLEVARRSAHYQPPRATGTEAPCDGSLEGAKEPGP